MAPGPHINRARLAVSTPTHCKTGELQRRPGFLEPNRQKERERDISVSLLPDPDYYNDAQKPLAPQGLMQGNDEGKI